MMTSNASDPNMPNITSPGSEEGQQSPSELFSSSVVSWRSLGGLFATLLVIGWIFIIVILIQEQKWQLVLVAWLLLYAAAHFCYWYFKRHHLLSFRSQICPRLRGNASGSAVRPARKGKDDPPSYEDILKSEIPPPAYYSVVVETPKQQAIGGKRSPFSLPKVFGGKGSRSPKNGEKATTNYNSYGGCSSRSISASLTSADTILPRQNDRPTSVPRHKPISRPPSYREHEPSRPTSSRLIASSAEPILLPIQNNLGLVDEPLSHPSS